jgi:hypothetical protein
MIEKKELIKSMIVGFQQSIPLASFHRELVILIMASLIQLYMNKK